MGDPDDRAAVNRGSSWREWARPASSRASDPGDHDDEFGLELDWPTGANTLTPADRPTGAVANAAGTVALDPVVDDEEWVTSDDEPVGEVPPTRPSLRSAPRRKPAADAANRALGPLLPAMYARLDDVTDRLAATEAAMLHRLSGLEDRLVHALETAEAPSPAPVEGLAELAADVADVRRQLGGLHGEVQEIRDLVASAVTAPPRAPDLSELRDTMAETVRAALGAPAPPLDIAELREAMDDTVRTLRDQIQAMADDVAGNGADLRSVGEELTLLRRRVGVRARPPQLDEATIDKLAEVVIDRLAASFEVVTDAPTPADPTSTRRRRGTR